MVSVTETCRDIDELAPAAKLAVRLFFYECYKAKIHIFITETYRSQERQNYLYAQGRTRPGNIVTWTLTSNHKSRLAWDIGASTVDGNTNIYNTAIIKKAGAIAVKLGITWGGTWTNNLDYPHFEVKSTWKLPKGYSLDGIVVSIPTRSNNRIVVTNSVNKLPQVNTTITDKDKTNQEDGEMATKVTLKDVGNPTLRTSAITFVKNALAKGKITDQSWLKSAEDGTLPVDDLFLLYLHANLTGPTIADASSAALRKEYTEMIKEAGPNGDKTLSSDTWEKQAENGTLGIVDALLLPHTIEQRRKEKQKEAEKK